MNIINRYTVQTLKKNKLRTLVTIVGIILSTAMFTGVTSIVSSLQQYVINLELAEEGAWEGRINNLSGEQAKKLCKKKDVKDATVADMVGYAKLEDSQNELKPYLCIQSIKNNFKDFSPLNISEGRMAEKSDELVLPQHLQENGGITYHVGDTITLEVGRREVEGQEAGQGVQYIEGIQESIIQTSSKTYRIVGICERPPIESIYSPGYTAFTVDADDVLYSDVLFIYKNPKKIQSFITKYLVREIGRNKNSIADGVDYQVHKQLMNFRGQSANENYMQMLFIMATVLILIIMVASVTLIYNAFSISVSERTKQFGLLKSIGATKKQIRHSVYFEGLCLCGIGIPLGVLGGLLGIAVTLHFVGDIMKEFMLNGSSDVSLHLTVMPEAIVIAVIVALVTVLISSMIPAVRAVRMTAIEALRESRDVRIRSRNVRSSGLVYRLFGFEGMLANKNFKRNRRKYRLTVFSLSISVILFIVTTCFNGYMSESVRIMEQAITADIRLGAEEKKMAGISLDDELKGLERVQDVDAAAYSRQVNHTYLILDKEDVDEEFYELNLSGGNLNNYIVSHKKSDKVLVDAYLFFVDDVSYEKYLKDNHLDVDQHMDSKNPSPIIWDEVQGISESNTIVKCHVFKKNYLPEKLYCINKIKGYEYTEDYSLIDAQKEEFPFVKISEEDKEEEPSEEMLPAKKAVTKISLDSGRVVDASSKKAPLGIGSINPWTYGVTMALPYSVLEQISNQVDLYEVININFSAKNYKKAYSNLSSYLKNNSGFDKEITSHLYNERETAEANRALLIVVDIFVYGFIILIALIVVANIFNTISTNIQLRRKEFAMLKSVGMAKRGFDRMMNYECLLYGMKSLVIGLPISFILCYLVNRSLQVGWNAAFSIPWNSVAIVIVTVFVMVFGSMLYSMRKIKKDNPIEALRNDNM